MPPAAPRLCLLIVPNPFEFSDLFERRCGMAPDLFILIVTRFPEERNGIFSNICNRRACPT